MSKQVHLIDAHICQAKRVRTASMVVGSSADRTEWRLGLSVLSFDDWPVEHWVGQKKSMKAMEMKKRAPLTYSLNDLKEIF